MKLLTTAIIALTVMTNPIKKEKKMIKVDESKVEWKGYKVAGSHEGTINLTSGVLEFNDETLVGGEFKVDMTSISSTDLEGEYKDKLDGHLKSYDFFGVENHPEATITFTRVTPKGKTSYEVQGNLTIKGNTNPVTFDMSVYGSKATASLKVDRSKYDVRYGSKSFFDNLKDKAIYDEFDLNVDLQF